MMTAMPTVLELSVAHLLHPHECFSELDRPGTNRSFASGIRVRIMHLVIKLS